MNSVYVASPFFGASKEETRQNIIYARLCMLDSLKRGEAPYLSHLLYTQVWSEANREAGLLAGAAWREAADVIALYIDLGISSGMDLARKDPAVTAAEKPVVLRSLFPGAVVAMVRAQLARMNLETFPELTR